MTSSYTIDLLVHPSVRLVDLLSQITRIEIQVPLLGRRRKSVELAIQHPNDLARLVIADRLALPIPQDGHGEAAGVVGGRFEVELFQMTESVVGFERALGLRVGERPSVGAHQPIDDGDGKNLF